MKPMKLLSKIKRLLFVQYRLTVYYHGEQHPRNIYSTNRQILISLANHTGAHSWSIYKSGPFGLPEREVDCYMKGDRP